VFRSCGQSLFFPHHLVHNKLFVVIIDQTADTRLFVNIAAILLEFSYSGQNIVIYGILYV